MVLVCQDSKIRNDVLVMVGKFLLSKLLQVQHSSEVSSYCIFDIISHKKRMKFNHSTGSLRYVLFMLTNKNTLNWNRYICLECSWED